VHHAEEEADAAVGLRAPVLPLRLAEQLEVLVRLGGAVLPVPAGRGLGELLPGSHLLLHPGGGALRGPWHAHAVCNVRLVLSALALPRLGLRGVLAHSLLGLPHGLARRLGSIGVSLRVCGVGHHEGHLEHVVERVLLPRGEQLPRPVEVPLRRDRQAHEPRAKLRRRRLRTDGRVEHQPRCEGHEGKTDAQALEVDARDENGRPRELQARAALHKDGDAVPEAHRQDGGVGLHLDLGNRCQVRAILAEHANLRNRHLPARGEALPAQALVILEVGAVVAPAKDPGLLRHPRGLHCGLVLVRGAEIALRRRSVPGE